MNILLDHFDINQPWGYEYFKNIINKDMKITYIPFAFHEDWIHNANEWQEWYGKYVGSHYRQFTNPLLPFGINEDSIEYVNYFIDDTIAAMNKINKSDIIIFSGGLPDRIIDRLNEMHLMETIENYRGIIMGWSAGSMVQCEDYYVSPDEDYPKYERHQGLKGIKGLAVEVHYQELPEQIASIERYIRETGNKVYLSTSESALIVDNDITLLGNMKEYHP